MFCSNCGSEVNDDDKFCNNCGESLNSEKENSNDELIESSTENSDSKDEKKEKWYKRKWFVIPLIMLFFPVGLLLMWRSNDFGKRSKFIVSGIFILLMLIGVVSPEEDATVSKSQESKDKKVQKVKTSTSEKKENQSQIESLGSIKGWAIFSGTKDRLSHWTPDSGNKMVLVTTQIKNLSDEDYRLNIGKIQLKDNKGYTYRCKSGMIKEKFSSFNNLIPNEIFYYTLAFEAPANTKPNELIFTFNRGKEEKRLSISDEKPQKLLNNTGDSLYKEDEGRLDDLKVGIENINLNKETKKLTVVFTLKNNANTEIDLSNQGTPISYPYLKDNYGRYANRIKSSSLPSSINEGEKLRWRTKFDMSKIDSPVYLSLERGLFNIDKITWNLKF